MNTVDEILDYAIDQEQLISLDLQQLKTVWQSYLEEVFST